MVGFNELKKLILKLGKKFFLEILIPRQVLLDQLPQDGLFRLPADLPLPSLARGQVRAPVVHLVDGPNDVPVVAVVGQSRVEHAR